MPEQSVSSGGLCAVVDGLPIVKWASESLVGRLLDTTASAGHPLPFAACSLMHLRGGRHMEAKLAITVLLTVSILIATTAIHLRGASRSLAGHRKTRRKPSGEIARRATGDHLCAFDRDRPLRRRVRARHRATAARPLHSDTADARSRPRVLCL